LFVISRRQAQSVMVKYLLCANSKIPDGTPRLLQLFIKHTSTNFKLVGDSYRIFKTQNSQV